MHDVAEPAVDKASAKLKGKAAAYTNKKGAGATKRSSAKKASQEKATRQAESDEDMPEVDIEVSLEEEQETQSDADVAKEGQGKGQAGKGKKGGKRAAANKPGSVKAGDAAGVLLTKLPRLLSQCLLPTPISCIGSV